MQKTLLNLIKNTAKITALLVVIAFAFSVSPTVSFADTADGSLTVCRMFTVPATLSIATSTASIPHSTFAMSISTSTTFMNKVLFPDSTTTFDSKDTIVTSFGYNSLAPMDLSHLVDSHCVKKSVPFGEYYYTPDVITSSKNLFNTVLYNDKLSTSELKELIVNDLYSLGLTSSTNVHEYTPELFDNDHYNDTLTNIISDGRIIISEQNPDRVIFVVHSIVLDSSSTPAPSCALSNQSVFSDSTTKVDGHDAVNVALVHPLWSAKIDGATWIWSEDVVQDFVGTTTKIFTKDFTIQGNTLGAKLHIAADDYYKIWINDTFVVDSGISEGNSNHLEQDILDITQYVKSGSNTIKFEITNHSVTPFPGISAYNNPAGLMYRIDIQSEQCPLPNTPPTITLNGDVITKLKIGDVFAEPGFVSSDKEDGDITSKVVVTGTVDTSKVGTYTITYTVTDSGGLTTTVYRIVSIEKETIVVPPPPVQCNLLVLNSFDTGSTLPRRLTNYNNGFGPIIGATSTQLANVIGGELDIVHAVDNPYSSDSTIYNHPNGHVLAISNGTDEKSTVKLSWDGQDNSKTLNTSGLNNLDLSFGGKRDRIVFKYSSDFTDNKTVPVKIRIYSDENNWSSVTIPLYGDVNSFLKAEVKFSDFVKEVGNGADFSKVGAIVMEIDLTSRGGHDFAIGQIELPCLIENQCLLPEITSTVGMVIWANEPFSHTIKATSTDSVITVETANLPVGLTYSTTTNTISGTPTIAGTYHFKITATNSCGSDIKDFLLVVNPSTPQCTITSVTSSLTANGKVGEDFQYILTGNNVTSFGASNLPSGLSYSNGVISGKPTSAGVYNITLNSYNSCSVDSKILILTVEAGQCPLPSITSGLTANGKVGENFSYTMFASANATTLTIDSSKLPAGLAYATSTNTISGTPTVDGVFNIPLIAGNSCGNDTKTLVITIEKLPAPPTPVGKVTFCMLYGDKDNVLATSSNGLPAGSFALKFGTSTDFANPLQSKTWVPTSFTPNRKAIGQSLDAECITYDNLSLTTHYYSALNQTGDRWSIAKYSDQYNQPVNNIFDLFNFGASNPNADGKLELTPEKREHTVIMYANYVPAPTPPPTPPTMYLPQMPACSAGSVFGTVTNVFNQNRFNHGYHPNNIPGSYIELDPGLLSSGNSLDWYWVHPSGVGNYVQWDLGSSATKVRIYPSQDHSPYPDEFHEYDVEVSLNGTDWFKATSTATYVDDITNVRVHDGVKDYTATSQFRYVRIAPNGISGEDMEIDAVQLCENIVPVVADLLVSKTVSESNPAVSDSLTYTITVKNNGYSNATNIVVTDILPSTLNFVSASTSVGAYNNTTGIWTVGNLSNGSSVILDIRVSIKSGNEGKKITNTVTVSASENDPNLTNNTSSVDVNVKPVPQCTLPSITSPLTLSGKVGDAMSYVLTGSNTADFEVATSSLPAGLTYSTTTKTISGTPTVSGTFNVLLKAKNSCGEDVKTVVITIAGLPQCTLPSITSPLTLSGKVGDAMSYVLTGSNTADFEVATSSLPAGVTYATSTKTISGTPTVSGTFNVSLKAVNSCGNDTKTLVITVEPKNVQCLLPEITSGLRQEITANQQFSYQITASSTSSAKFNLSTSTLPSWLSFSATTNTFSGKTAETGTYTIKGEFENSCGITPVTLTIVVLPTPPGGGCSGNCSTPTPTPITGGGGGNGPIVPNPTPAPTVIPQPNSCYYLFDYLKKGWDNNPVEVRKLQVFLKELEGFNVEITGIYDDQTIVALNAFQNRYKDDVLTPWGHTAPTSFTYITTKKKVNEIYCKRAFPVTVEQQSEIDAYRNFLAELNRQGITVPNRPTTGGVTIPEIIIPENIPAIGEVGFIETQRNNLTTGAGVSTTTEELSNSLIASVLSSGRSLGNFAGAILSWPFDWIKSLFDRDEKVSAGQCSEVSKCCCCGNDNGNWFTWLLLIIIAILLYQIYREKRLQRKLLEANQELELANK